MITDKRLAEIREWTKKHFNGYPPSPQEAELLELVECYAAARAVTRGYDSDLFNAAMDRIFSLFPEATP